MQKCTVKRCEETVRRKDRKKHEDENMSRHYSLLKEENERILWSASKMVSLPEMQRNLLTVSLEWNYSICNPKCFVTIMHQSIPPAPSTPPGWPPGISIFFALDGKFPGVGTLELSNPPGWGRKKGQMPRPPSTLQHFSLIAQSNSAILSILMCDFLFQLTSSFVIALGF